MLFNLLAPLADEYSVLFLFRSLTFRAGGAVVGAHLAGRGIVTRLFGGPAFDDHMRITLGPEEDLEALLAALREFLDH